LIRREIITAVAALGLSGIGAVNGLYPHLARPTAPTDEVVVVNERPVAFNVQFSTNLAAPSEADVTLLTVVDPTTSSSAAAIAPVVNGLSMEQLMQLLAQARPAATIREIRVKREQGATIYEVDFSDNYRLKVNAADAQMLSLDPISSKPPPPHRRVQGFTAQTTLLDAVSLAQQRQPSAIFKDAKLEIHDGLLVYKVKFEGGIDIFVDANTGQHLFTKLSRNQWDTSSLPIQPAAAIQTAQAAYPDAVVLEWKVKFEDGTVAYELKLHNRVKIFVNAVNGLILEIRS
jgi:uncharacterized membrane protein YkoI